MNMLLLRMILRRLRAEYIRFSLLTIVLATTTAVYVSMFSIERLSVGSIQRMSGLTESDRVIKIEALSSTAQSHDFDWVQKILPPEATGEIVYEAGKPPLFLITVSESLNLDALAESLRLRAHYVENRFEFKTPALVASQAAQITDSFQKNIRILISMAAGICLFILLTSANLSAAQAKRELAILRSLGVPQTTTSLILVLEGGVLGIISGVIGITLGLPLTRGLSEAIVQAVANQYSSGFTISASPTIPEIMWGLGATILTALVGYSLTIITNRSIPPAQLLRDRASSEVKSSLLLLITAVLGGLFGCSILLNLNEVIGSILLFTSGMSASITALIYIARALRKKIPTLHMALTRQVIASMTFPKILSLSAISLACILLIGMGVFVGSFETTLLDWAKKVLNAEIFIQAPREQGINQNILSALQEDPRVDELLATTFTPITIKNRSVVLGSAPFRSKHAINNYRIIEGTYNASALQAGEEILVSEPAKRKLRLKVGEMLTIFDRPMRVGGVFQDFSKDQGLILAERNTIASINGVQRADTAIVYLKDPSTKDTLIKELQKRGVPAQSQQDLLNEVQRIFSETFQITRILHVLILLVCGTGFLLSLLQQMWEERTSLLVIRILGAGRREVLNAFMNQSIVYACISIGIGSLWGGILGWYLCTYINPRAFGWSIVPEWPIAAFVQPSAMLAILLVALSILAVFMRSSQQNLRVYDA